MKFNILQSIVLILAQFLVISNAGATTKTISATVSESTISSIDGLNIKFTLPFEWNDAIVGLKYTLNNIKSLPDSLFYRKSIELNTDNKLSFDADYSLADQKIELTTVLDNKQTGLTGKLVTDNVNLFTKVGLKLKKSIQDYQVTIDSFYDKLKNNYDINTKVTKDRITTDLAYNTVENNPILSVSVDIDDVSSIAPSISLTTGDISYKYSRKLSAGSISGKFIPDDKVEVEWKENVSNGVWITKADIPLDRSKSTKIALTKQWDY